MPGWGALGGWPTASDAAASAFPHVPGALSTEGNDGSNNLTAYTELALSAFTR